MIDYNTLRLDACLMAPPSGKEYQVVATDRDLPAHVDLSAYCTPVENQGQIGSCTANATVGALEYHQRRLGYQAVDLSRIFAYYNSRKIAGTIHQDSGASIAHAMASVLAFGVCQESVWPYDPGAFAVEPPPQAYLDASRFEAVEYARVERGNGVLSSLAEGFPVVFGIWLPQRCYQEAGETGRIPSPSAAERRERSGGHSMLIVGYDLNEQTYLVRNSWGAAWGDKGYCRIPFEVMDGCSHAEAFWIIGKLEQAGNFKVVRPRQQQPPAAPENRAPGISPGIPPGMAGSGLGGRADSMRDEIRRSLEADIRGTSERIRQRFANVGQGTANGKARGSGACVAQGCNCQAYSGNGYTCDNCGHPYGDHY